MALVNAKWTVEDYHRMIDAGILDDRQVELLRGEIVERVPEGLPHAYYSDETAQYLRQLLGNRAKVREGKPITLPNQSEPEPDLAVAWQFPEGVIVEPLGEVYLRHHPYPENIFWLIEFSQSSLVKDLEDKSRIYAEAGIQEYWVVNLRQKQLVVFRDPHLDKFRSQQTLERGSIAPIAFQEISVSIDRVLGK